MAITAIIITRTIKMTIMVTISIARLYGGKGGWSSKSQGVVPARKMPVLEKERGRKGRENGMEGDGEGTREKLKERKKDGRRGCSKGSRERVLVRTKEPRNRKYGES